MAFNPVQALLEGQQAGDAMQQREIQQRIAQQSQQQGFNPLANQDINQLQALNPQAGGDILNGFLKLDEERQRSFFTDNRKLKNLLEANNKEGALSLLADRLKQGARIADSGGQPFNPADTLEVQQDILNNDIQGALQKSTIVDNVAIDTGFLKGSNLTPDQREFKQFKSMEEGADKQAFGKLIGAISKTATAEERGKIQQVVGDIKTIQDVKRASGKETAKLAVQLKLKPDVQRAVVLAQELAKGEAAKTNSERGNDRALNVYNVAKDGLLGAMSGATTGPAAGWIPALTSNQQIADGAVAAMAPVLKQIFRTAGEGNFSDHDQAVLMGMVPTRSDTPKARVAKLKLIDTIVMAKLGGNIPPAQNAQQPVQQGAMTPEEQAELDELESRFGGQ